MGGRWDKVAGGIKSFVDNPVTRLAKGVTLLLIGLSEASRTFRDDLSHGHVRVGHGLIIIGLFGILEAFPHLIGALEASESFLELRRVEDRGEDRAETP